MLALLKAGEQLLTRDRARFLKVVLLCEAYNSAYRGDGDESGLPWLGAFNSAGKASA